jgi:hypothetical protein
MKIRALRRSELRQFATMLQYVYLRPTWDNPRNLFLTPEPTVEHLYINLRIDPERSPSDIC